MSVGKLYECHAGCIPTSRPVFLGQALDPDFGEAFIEGELKEGLLKKMNKIQKSQKLSFVDHLLYFMLLLSWI